MGENNNAPLLSRALFQVLQAPVRADTCSKYWEAVWYNDGYKEIISIYMKAEIKNKQS